MKIYTRTGDDGDTALFGGTRVPKSDRRVQAYGDVDELNASIGVAIAAEPVDWERALLVSLQQDLFGLGAQLATPEPTKMAKALEKAKLRSDRVRELEAAIDRLDRALPPLKAFILPGGSPKAAHLHHARTVCRRAERQVVALEDGVPATIIVYLNRLSDLLFVLARAANADASVDETEW